MRSKPIRSGDILFFEKSYFKLKPGRSPKSMYRGAKTSPYEYCGYVKYYGMVLKHSYGSDVGLHTFTILPLILEEIDIKNDVYIYEEGEKFLIKGKNLYSSLIAHYPFIYSILEFDKDVSKEVQGDFYYRDRVSKSFSPDVRGFDLNDEKIYNVLLNALKNYYIDDDRVLKAVKQFSDEIKKVNRRLFNDLVVFGII